MADDRRPRNTRSALLLLALAGVFFVGIMIKVALVGL